MKLSIIIPIYNVKPYLKSCLELLLEQVQNHKSVEVIMIDDGSTDGSSNICDYYSSICSNMKVIHNTNQGTGKSRNCGICNASGEYIYFVDPDDYISTDCVKQILNLIEKKVELIIFSYWNVYFKKRKKDEKNTNINKKMDRKEFRNFFIKLFEKDMLYTVWNKVYKKDFLLKNNLFFGFETMGQDTRFNLRVYEKVSEVYVSNKKLYFYVLNRNGSSTNKYRKNRFNLKSQEAFLVAKLLDDMQINDGLFLSKYYKKTLLESVMYVSSSQLSFKRKVQKVQDIFDSDLFLTAKVYDKKNSSFLEKLLFSEQKQLLIIYLCFRKKVKDLFF